MWRLVDLPQVPLLYQWHEWVVPEMWRANGAGGVIGEGQYWRPKPGQQCNALIVWPFHYGDGDPEPLVYACQDVVTGECFNLHRVVLRQMWEPSEMERHEAA